jgi:outer membrane biosynthesis protein TonB
MAKRLGVTSAVRVEVVVWANGSVKSTRMREGNPVLIPSSADAAGKWKVEPTSAETTGIVKLTFGPRRQQ